MKPFNLKHQPTDLHPDLPLQPRKPAKFFQLLQTHWQRWLNRLIQKNELRVWQTCDRHGNVLWHAFDPLTEEAVTCGSEEAIRVWVEKHYYRNPDELQKQYDRQQYQLIALR